MKIIFHSNRFFSYFVFISSSRFARARLWLQILARPPIRVRCCWLNKPPRYQLDGSGTVNINSICVLLTFNCIETFEYAERIKTNENYYYLLLRVTCIMIAVNIGFGRFFNGERAKKKCLICLSDKRVFFSQWINLLFIASQRHLFGAGEVTALKIWIKNLKGDSMWIFCCCCVNAVIVHTINQMDCEISIESVTFYCFDLCIINIERRRLWRQQRLN